MRLGGGGSAPAADLAWARLRKHAAADQAVASNAGVQVSWNDFATSDAAVYSQVGNFLRILEDGVYSLTARLFWATLAGAPLSTEMYFNGIDADNFAAYTGADVYVDVQSVSTLHLIARLGVGQSVGLFVYQLSGAGWTIAGTDGTILEAIRLGSATMTDRDFP